MAFDRLLREVETIADFPVYKPLRDELEYLDLTGCGGLLERLGPRRQRDHLGDSRPAGGKRVEAIRVLAVPRQDFVTLSSIHWGKYRRTPPKL